MSQFMLFLYDDPQDFADVSPDEMQRIVEEYSAWREGLQSGGRLIGANKLKDEGGKHVSLVDGDVRIVDGPYSEAKEIIGGYFIVEASDYDQAVELTRDCPHLKYGKRTEIRRIDPIHD